MPSTKSYKPTDSELEILQVLWQKKLASVREVHEEISRTKETGYTTTLKLMQIMFEKGLVDRDASAKIHIYKPIISREHTQTIFVDKIIDGLFSGSPAQLVMQALGNHKASPQELAEIRNFLDNIK